VLPRLAAVHRIGLERRSPLSDRLCASVHRGSAARSAKVGNNMSDEELIIHVSPKEEPTQLAAHPKDQRRAAVALWISCTSLLLAIAAATGSVWQAVEAHKARIEAAINADAQRLDVERSSRAAEQSAGASVSLADAARRSAIAEEENAKTSSRSADAAVDSLAAQTRPFIDVLSAHYDRSSDEVVFQLRNSGATTAYGLDLRSWLQGTSQIDERLEKRRIRGCPPPMIGYLLDPKNLVSGESTIAGLPRPTGDAAYGPGCSPGAESEVGPRSSVFDKYFGSESPDPDVYIMLAIRYVGRDRRRYEQVYCYSDDTSKDGASLPPCGYRE